MNGKFVLWVSRELDEHRVNKKRRRKLEKEDKTGKKGSMILLSRSLYLSLDGWLMFMSYHYFYPVSTKMKTCSFFGFVEK